MMRVHLCAEVFDRRRLTRIEGNRVDVCDTILLDTMRHHDDLCTASNRSSGRWRGERRDEYVLRTHHDGIV